MKVDSSRRKKKNKKERIPTLIFHTTYLDKTKQRPSQVTMLQTYLGKHYVVKSHHRKSLRSSSSVEFRRNHRPHHTHYYNCLQCVSNRQRIRNTVTKSCTILTGEVIIQWHHQRDPNMNWTQLVFMRHKVRHPTRYLRVPRTWVRDWNFVHYLLVSVRSDPTQPDLLRPKLRRLLSTFVTGITPSLPSKIRGPRYEVLSRLIDDDVASWSYPFWSTETKMSDCPVSSWNKVLTVNRPEGGW